jgi:hypothetical protein
MDVGRCVAAGCYDHADLARFAEDARAVMPDIDAVTMATPPGGSQQSVLFTVPATWPVGDYVAWLEINVEGDYNGAWSVGTNPTPTTPANAWDSWAIGYGYAYRGQPSVVFAVPFTLGPVGDGSFATSTPVGRSSWNVWADDVGTLEPTASMTDDASGAPGSGADRLLRDSDGQRLVVKTLVLSDLPDPVVVPESDAGTLPPAPTDQAGAGAEPTAGTGGSGSNAGAGAGHTAAHGGGSSGSDPSRGTILETSGGGLDGPVGAIYDLELRHHDNELRAHTWIALRFRAAHSKQPLHGYDVRVATLPIVDEASFIRNGREAKNATDDAEGATLLMLPSDVPAGRFIETSVGDLVAQTHYFVAVRATDRLNRHGPITVAEVTTAARRFATVTPCFIATAAYGTPQASEVSVLRQARDRYLMSHAPGRALVSAYYALGPRLAQPLRTHGNLRAVVRWLLSPVVAMAQRVMGP